MFGQSMRQMENGFASICHAIAVSSRQMQLFNAGVASFKIFKVE